MIIKRIKKGEDGMTVEMLLDEQQTTFLLNFAIGFLVSQGVVNFYDVDEEDAEKDVTEKTDSADFLLNVDTEKLHKA